MAVCGVYVIENTINGKVYVGSAVNMQKRWYQHQSQLRAGTHGNRHLQRAFQNYGEAAFTFRVLEECPRETLLEREQHYLDSLDTVQQGYNIAPTAGSPLGVKRTEEQRRKTGERSRAWHAAHPRPPKEPRLPRPTPEKQEDEGTRIMVTLDDEAYAIYQEQPHHRRGAWISGLIKGAPPPDPPYLTATQARWLQDYGAAWLRYYKQNETG